MAILRLCSIPDCGKPVKGRGWCAGHYHRWTRHGDPLAGGPFYGEAQKFFDTVVVPYTGDDCLVWPFARLANGYPEMRVNGKTTLVHRLACRTVHGTPPTPKHEAAHSCGKGHHGCCNPRHLSWKTRAENKADEIVHGTRNRGGGNGHCKLTERDIRDIRSLAITTPHFAIADRYGVSVTTIRDIFKRRTWAWLE